MVVVGIPTLNFRQLEAAGDLLLVFPETVCVCVSTTYFTRHVGYLA